MVKNNKNSQMGLLKTIYQLIGKDKYKFILAIALMVIGTFCLAYAPKVAGKITDEFSKFATTNVFDGNVIVTLLISLLALYVVGNLLKMVTDRMMIFISSNVTLKLRDELHEKMHNVPINYIDSTPSGDIIARLTNDMSSVESMISSTLATLFVQFIIIILVIIMMLILNVELSIIYLILIPLSFGILKFISSRTKVQYKKQQKLVGKLNGVIGDNFNNHLIVKSYNMEEKSLDKFDKINNQIFESYFKSRFYSGFIIPINTILTNLGYIGICVFGGYFIISGSLTIGTFLAFILYGQMLTEPLTTIGNNLNILQSGFSSLENILDVLNVEEEKDFENSENLLENDVKGEIEFKNVKFGYSEDKILMDDVNFIAKSGTTNAIVGPSGAGKTTIVNLLMRFYDINDGTIYLDGKNIYKIKKDDFRKSFGMVLQDSWVFEGTIAENIGYGMENPTIEDIHKAAEMVGCDKFINLLPDGYDTVISEENTNLSVGEKQLLVLARTIISDPKILILDEATSQMDTRTELLVTKAMEEMMKGRTTFIIAHRLFTIKNADKIIFMKNGDIKEVGNHKELLELNGLYAEMYKSGSIKSE
ncbi:ABC transporter ATP-binding protein [Methanobrevibacter sp.]|uniref:ABC transporter ATP-binding protein n=1 Tax=Methanobrevibacter sp. TaxID=66852 RepID=UPI003D7EFEEF